MPSRNTPWVVASALLVLAGALPGPARSQAVTRAGEGPQTPSADEKAVRAADDAFVRDYNKGDSKALAALYTEDAEVVEADGARYRGRALIERGLAETFAASPGAKIAIEVDSIQFLTADAAKEEGRSLVTPARGAPVSRLYTVLFVKRDGRWLIASTREEPDPLVRPHDRLKDLEWMVGQWVDEGPDSETRFDCRWSEDGNFLTRTFAVKLAGKPALSGSQRIGWDPLARQVRSWEFDSEGGFGEGKWTRDGDRWVVKHTAVRPEGTTASATNVMTRVRPDTIRWTSTDRFVGDESVPDESYVLVRTPPQPGLKPKAPAAPSPNTERNPR